jgi:hypothetical protein
MIYPPSQQPSSGALSLAPEFDEADIQATLCRAHVHITRYYRAWLEGGASGEALTEVLAQEALVRIARMNCPAGDGGDAEVIASWLSVARDVALEAIGG